jgi:hypothetical protein
MNNLKISRIISFIETSKQKIIINLTKAVENCILRPIKY